MKVNIFDTYTEIAVIKKVWEVNILLEENVSVDVETLEVILGKAVSFI